MRKLGLQDFIDRLERRGDCLDYVGPRNNKGYGTFGRKRLSHRYSYSTFVGEIPEGMMVLHSCDNPRCVLPAHLRVGTAWENTRDMMKRGRSTATDTCSKCGEAWSYYQIKRQRYVCRPCESKRSLDRKRKKVKK